MTTASIHGEVVVITGASSGFGKGTARELAGRGASLVLAARRGELLDRLVGECESAGGAAVPVQADVSHADDVERLARTAIERFGRIDVWINNAGVGAIGPFERVPLADHEQVVRTNLLGTLYGSYVAYRQFLQQRAGTLINIASELGKHTVPYYASYAASKHGVVGLNEALRQELSEKDLPEIHVCTVMPTAHDTPFFDHAANYTGHEIEPPTPLHDPENVVEALVRLVENPKDNKIVGADGIVKILAKKVMPAVAETLATRQMERTQMKNAPPGPDSPGAVRSPTAVGTEVSAGRRHSR
jgi:short-subunit dehydrogenase